MNTSGGTVGGCSEVAELLGVTAGRVRRLCREGRVAGAEQIGAGWAIPLPPQVIPPKPSRRRPGAIEQDGKLPSFLAKRLPVESGTARRSIVAELEMQACRFAAHLAVVALREGDSKGRMHRLVRVAERANRRAERRYKANL